MRCVVGSRKSLPHEYISREYGISVPHVRIPGTIAPIPYREYLRGRVQLSPRAGDSIKHRRLRRFILFKLARARFPLSYFPAINIELLSYGFPRCDSLMPLPHFIISYPISIWYILYPTKLFLLERNASSSR